MMTETEIARIIECNQKLMAQNGELMLKLDAIERNPENVQDYIDCLERDSKSMLDVIKMLSKTNTQIRDHRDKLWRENVILRNRLLEENSGN